MNLLDIYREQLRLNKQLLATIGVPSSALEIMETDIAILEAIVEGCEAFLPGTLAQYLSEGDGELEQRLALRCALRELKFVFCNQNPNRSIEKLQLENEVYKILADDTVSSSLH